MRLVLMKTEKELLDEGFIITEDGSIYNSSFPIIYNFMKEDILGKVLEISKGNQVKNLPRNWQIDRKWIKAELNPDDYPEYFI